ncbi:hypothetical protein AKO1_013985, partial [Acrasis kona]
MNFSQPPDLCDNKYKSWTNITDCNYGSIISYCRITSLVLVFFCFWFSVFVLSHLITKRRQTQSKRSEDTQSAEVNSDLDSTVSQQSAANQSLIVDESRTKKAFKYYSLKTMYSDLTQFCIFCMILADMFFGVFYFSLLFVKVAQFEKFLTFSSSREENNRIYGYINTILAEITESYVISSGLWSVLISFCILLTVLNINKVFPSSMHRSVSNLSENSNDETTTTSEPDNDTLGRKKKIYQLCFLLLGFGLPAASSVMWAVIESLFMTRNNYKGTESFFADIIPNMVKNFTYISLEVINVVVRLAVYFSTKRIFSQNVTLKESFKAFSMRQKQSKLTRQLTLYTLPFLLFGTWIVVYRLFRDVKTLQFAYHNNIDDFDSNHLFNIFDLVLMCIHL